MTKKIITSLTEGRKKIFDIAEEVQTPETHYLLTEHGTPKVVVMSAAEFNSWEKTIALIDAKHISKKTIDDAKQATSFKRLEDILEKEGFIVADKARYTYDPSGSPDKKSTPPSGGRKKRSS